MPDLLVPQGADRPPVGLPTVVLKHGRGAPAELVSPRTCPPEMAFYAMLANILERLDMLEDRLKSSGQYRRDEGVEP